MKKIVILMLFVAVFVGMAVDYNCYRALDKFCGFTFGEKIDTNRYPVFAETVKGELVCRFRPEKRFMQFTDYLLIISPKTHLLSEIWLFKEFKKRDDATAYLKNVVAVVGKHYGKDKMDSVSSGASIFDLEANSCDDMYLLKFTNNVDIAIYGDWTGLFNFKLDDDKVYVKAISGKYRDLAKQEIEAIKREKERQERQRAIEREDASVLD